MISTRDIISFISLGGSPDPYYPRSATKFSDGNGDFHLGIFRWLNWVSKNAIFSVKKSPVKRNLIINHWEIGNPSWWYLCDTSSNFTIFRVVSKFGVISKVTSYFKMIQSNRRAVRSLRSFLSSWEAKGIQNVLPVFGTDSLPYIFFAIPTHRITSVLMNHPEQASSAAMSRIGRNLFSSPLFAQSRRPAGLDRDCNELEGRY
jgi:hypothetical protein